MAKKLTTDEFIEKARKIHGNKYDYSKVEYINKNTKVKIICPKHGEFEQSPSNHYKYDCPACGIEKAKDKKATPLKEFIKKAKKIHENKYDYSKVEYKNTYTKVKIICPKHGEFKQEPRDHLRGRGCNKCGREKTSKKLSKGTEWFIKEAEKIHGNKYDYSKLNYISGSKRVLIICSEHGEFEQIASVHLNGGGCPKCYGNNKMTTEEFVEKATEIHKNKYNYNKTNYINFHTKLIIYCPIHGYVKVRPDSHLSRGGCSICSKRNSKDEIEIYNYAKNLNINIKQNNREILNGLELDLYLPDYNLAIEFNGLYWHSEQKIINKNYHLKKTQLCEEKEIRLIHIFEDEWRFKQEIVKARLKHILNLDTNKIYARKTKIKEIDSKIKTAFLNKYHLQGTDNAVIKLGAFYDNELIAVMTFCKPRLALGQKQQKKDIWELSRYAVKADINFIGGASKLFKYFVRNYSPVEIYSYSDRRWNTGNLYKKLGFSFEYDTDPNYWYIIDNKRIHRFKYRKSELSNLLNTFDSNLTEYENMLNSGYDRIWDCGNSKWIWQ